MWAPTPGQPWQWQLTGALDLSVNVPVYNVDGFETTAAQVQQLHNAGKKVICYLDVGGWEPYRPDASQYPQAVLGADIEGWNEKWVDIRRIDLLSPVITARFDMCKQKGFDAVEVDDVDAYANNSGFPLSYADQIRFNTWLAGLAHARGMSIALKNDLDQVKDLASVFDFAINEECAAYDECAMLAPFRNMGKAVLHVEYNVAPSRFCPIAANLGFSSMQKRLDLDAWRVPC